MGGPCIRAPFFRKRTYMKNRKKNNNDRKQHEIVFQRMFDYKKRSEIVLEHKRVNQHMIRKG